MNTCTEFWMFGSRYGGVRKTIAYYTQPHTHNHFTVLWLLYRTIWVSRYQKKHSPAHTYCGHQSSLICFLNPSRSMASPCSIYMPDSLFPQSLFKPSLVHLLAWHPPPHTPHTSSSNHCLPLAAHTHAIAACFAVVSRSCHLIPISLSNLYL